MTTSTSVCAHCGIEFLPRLKDQKTCSTKCCRSFRKRCEKESRKRRYTNCQWCNAELTGSKNQMYCNNACRRADIRDKNPKPVYSAICQECGIAFSTNLSDQKFCCKQCTTSYHNRERELKPNTFYDCIVCGKHVEKYVIPHSVLIGNARNLYCSRQCKGKALSGDRHPMWSGGRLVVGGYVLVYDPDSTNKTRYTLEHRLVMERHIGRKLKKTEVVHHINEDTQDNRIENLQLCENQSEHKKIHDPFRERNEFGQYLPVREH